jgi:hypothetical protein
VDEGGVEESSGDPNGRSVPSFSSLIGVDELGASGWIFPTDAMEITGPSYILLPSNPPTCLAVSTLYKTEMIESPNSLRGAVRTDSTTSIRSTAHPACRARGRG